jgi:aspartate kinase
VIVQKFGGTSVADSERIRSVVRIVSESLSERPVVVVSALAGVTDLLVRSVDLARRGDREGLEPVFADLARRHRWAVSGAVSDAAMRHDLNLAIDGSLDELRTLLRSVRALGEGTPRSADVLLAFGELLSSRILCVALQSEGTPAVWIDPRQLVATDGSHGSAGVHLDRTAARVERVLRPVLDRGEVPVLGGFVGSAPDGATTTLGRGGSDTSAAVLGAVLSAAEVQIWTDVDGILTADPRIVPEAALRSEVSFAEAAEAAHYGARVLHPASIEPAVARRIPVRVRNTMRPNGVGTTVLASKPETAPTICCITSLSGIGYFRADAPVMRFDPKFAVERLQHCGGSVLAGVGALGLTAVVHTGETSRSSSPAEKRSLVCLVGDGLATRPGLRRRVGLALSGLDPDLLVVGASRNSAAAVIPTERLTASIRRLHEDFFSGGAA